jgi:CheY-like chemotaxis protein
MVDAVGGWYAVLAAFLPEAPIDAGATDYITKPIDVEELLDCMERWPSPAASAAIGA